MKLNSTLVGILLTVLCAGAWPLAAQAGDTAADANAPKPINTIIELFTSQGCSSCPPADALLKTYADTDGVLALSLPVDYWDYLGWKDTLASPRNTERQRIYARTIGRGPVYTPQAVINGQTDAIGSDQAAIDRAVSKSSKLLESRRVPLTFRRQSSSVTVDVGSAPEGSSVQAATLWLIVLTKNTDVEIRRGENKGKSISYTNVVRQMTPLGTWDGKPRTFELALAAMMDPQTEDSAVVLQEGADGNDAIIGAAWLNR